MNESEESPEETTEAPEVEERPLSSAEDVELDVREALEEVNAKAAKEEPVEEEPPATEPTTEPPQEDKSKRGPRKKVVEITSGETPAPSTWNAEGKEWFNKQSPEAKKQISRRARDLDSEIGKASRLKVQMEREYADIHETIKGFEPEIGKLGLTRSEYIKSLATADLRLRYDLEGSLEELARNAGTTLEEIVARRSAGGQTQVQTSGLSSLEKKVQLLESRLSQEAQAKENAARQEGTVVFETFRNEVNSQGQYLRPELHDESFAPSFSELVLGQRKAFPNATPREVLERAYLAATGKTIQNPRAPAVNNQQHIENARKANSSVRGSGAAPKPITRSVPDSVEDTAMEVAREMGLI